MIQIDDTIVALATPPGEAALAIVRVSGPDCRPLLSLIQSGTTAPKQPLPRSATLLPYSLQSGDHLDDLIAVFYKGPASYTGEDLLEFIPHGNPHIVRRLIEDLVQRGCRRAEPGEFTRRAFLNGKLDLSQAEAVADVIRARSDRALRAAQQQLQGHLGAEVESLQANLLSISANLEAYIDFPEEDLPPEDAVGPRNAIQSLADRIDRLLSFQKYRNLLFEGARVVLAGAVNAGKSSLLNALLHENRVLVSDQPGTTRDFIEVGLRVGPYPLRLIDTAGLRKEATGLESQGIELTHQQVQSADLLLFVLDGTQPAPDPGQIDPGAHKGIVLSNKADLPNWQTHADFLPGLPHLAVSAKTGEGLDQLLQALRDHLEAGLEIPSAEALLLSTRQNACFREVREHLAAALTKLESGHLRELAASDVRSALHILGEVTGRIDNEAMLDALFAQFCIGK
ncbi:MAG: tRNA uridine-5-carboxymethylaminomethyl(34) synthesis GTPase MnmE [Opitutales bacterium]|nr:tRNA uridine-5-carboxymethylaminomethyl(34) synthesis GTPase MnmE [Opitutales bacterium]